MDAELKFLPAEAPQGFSTLAMAQWDGKPEPIVRELLQNCLDAAREADREQAEVMFTIADRPLKSLPGLQAYRTAFEAAVKERSAGPQPAGEKRTIERIRNVLDREQTRLLFCRDNGIGLNDQVLDGLLTEGNSTKTTIGGGTTGVGHLTAFAASDLRYVLYAGRSRSGGDLRDYISGHAVLASHKSPKKRGSGISGNGYLLRPGAGSLFEDAKYSDTAPPILREQLDSLTDTGSVICITGFNDFRDERKKVVESLQRVSAIHFLAAIAMGKMVVHIDNGRDTAIVDKSTLPTILLPISNQRRARNVFIAGQQVYRAWRVFDQGETLESGVDGVVIRFRRRTDDEGHESSRVQLYRDGMWITNKAPELEYSDFAGNLPFDAVVLVEEGKLYDLIRNAEGPEHRGLDRERLGPNRWAELRRLLGIVRDRLREAAGTMEREKTFTPDNFATFSGDTLRAAEPMRPYRPRLSVGAADTATVLQTGEDTGDRPDDPDPNPSPNPNPPQPSPPRRLQPKPGNGVPMRTSIAPQRNAAGEVDTLRVQWKLTERDNLPDLVGVRVRLPSGSDATCDRPLPPEWLPLAAIEHPKGKEKASGKSTTEISIPPADGHLTITLAEPLPDASAIEVDVVRRRQESDDA